MSERASSQAPLAQQIFSKRMLICVFTGFASGMPLYVLLTLVPAWLSESGVSLAAIGLFALVGMPYNWKFLWAPLMDRFVPFPLGKRRSWMLIFQVALILAIAAMGLLDPSENLSLVAVFAFAVALFSASQDISIDAYRRELLPDAELGLGNSIHVATYRLSTLVPGSLSRVLADRLPWNLVFLITASCMLLGVRMTSVVKEPRRAVERALGIRDTFSKPFIEYLERKGLRSLLIVLAFLVLYKLGDNMATALSTPFYLELGFTMTEIGLVAKTAALWAVLIGGLFGGIVMLRLGINRALWVFGVVQILSIFGFAYLANQAPNLWLLAGVIAFEYFGVGLGTAALTAFMARETNPTFAATQLALFTALATVPRTFVNASTGFISDALGWSSFFLLCACFAIPGLLMLPWVAPWGQEASDAAADGG
ncbi:MAG: AmpG family muropeptide MFS transporter [Pseudomonadota bacterium]